MLRENYQFYSTTKVKISRQNVDILPKVYRVHLNVKHCETLRVISTFTGQNALSGIVQDGQNYSKNQSKMPVYIFRSTVKKKRQLTDFDLYSNFQLKCLNSRRVKRDVFNYLT